MKNDIFVANLLLRGFTKSATIAPCVAYHIFLKSKRGYKNCVSVYLTSALIKIVESGEVINSTDRVEALKVLDARIAEANNGH